MKRNIMIGRPGWWKTNLVVTGILCAVLAGCASPDPSALMRSSEQAGIPATGRAGRDALEVSEFPLVEQSTDNPNHAGFQDRVPQAVSARAGFGPFRAHSDLSEPNRVLNQFGYRLAFNPSPPFSGYALYFGSQLVLRDIERFSAVQLSPDGNNFDLAYETLEGSLGTVNADGIAAQTSAGPGDPYQDRLAFSGSLSELGQTTWVDGGGDSLPDNTQEVFGRREIAGSPFFFYTRDGQTFLRHAGRDLPFIYDLVVHDNPPETAMYNPGTSGKVTWFYALRDGLWYYVEVCE